MTDHDPNKNDCEAAHVTRDGELTYEIGETETPSTAVVRAVASVTNTTVLDLDPLYDVIDPEHLDELSESNALIESAITFTFNGCQVTVTQGTVQIQEHTSDAS